MRQKRGGRAALCLATLCLLLATVAQAGVQLVWGPVVGDLTTHSVQMTWYTNVPAYGAVEMGGRELARGGPEQAHRVKLEGLRPGHRYPYRLVVEAEGHRTYSRWYSFTTPEAGLDQFVFCAYGDSRSRPSAHRQVVAAMAKFHPRLIMNSGDLVEDGNSLEAWHRFFPVIARFSPLVPLYPCLGNHEGNAELYYRLLPLPAGGGDFGCEWYATVYGSCQFIVLDSCQRLEEQATWLRDLLGQGKPPGVAWRIVMFHHPPYSSGPHEPDEGVLKYFCPLLEAPGGADLVFCGHNHSYERSLRGRLNYVQVGGGGAPLYQPSRENPYRQAMNVALSFARVEVSPQELVVTALDIKLSPFDRFIVQH